MQHIEIGENQTGIRFEIVDTGIGISEEVCSRLFQPFTQADNSTTRKFGGTGLGLSICKKLVDLMGGEIGVFSEEGKGSTFWFEIPTETVGTDSTTVELPELDGLAVLVVEDHPAAVREISNSLRSMGAEVEACGSVEEAFSLVKQRPFNVGVIDQGLPDGLGIDLIKDIMDIRPSMGLLMYTVRDDYGLQHSLRSLGATYLTKPASRAGLGEAVKDAARQDNQAVLSGPKKLLIADDTETVRDILRRQLSMFDVEFDMVENGLEAYNRLQEEEYGLLISDLHMPEMDGYCLIKKIREDEKNNGTEIPFPVIVLTADVQMAQRQSYLSEGFNECLLKPVSLGQLRQMLIRWGLLDEDLAIKALDSIAPSAENKGGKNDGNGANDTAPAIDLKAMEEQMGAVNADTIEMIGMFTELTRPLVEDIRKAHTDKDGHQLSELGHSLKGSARSACCVLLGDLASDLQDDSNDVEKCTELVGKIEKEFERVCKQAEELKKRFQ
jgi:CheY-like chemotaxis protein/HPt (histidine-containing phosphotransfer) domain-containing protein